MTTAARLVAYGVQSGFFVLLDQLLKFYSRSEPLFTWYLLKPWLGWEHFENTGIAFGLPLPNAAILFITPPILLALLLAFMRSREPQTALGLSFIIGGAVSNYIDRVLWGATIDYFRIVTGIVNAADMMIAAGFVILAVKDRKKT